MVLAVAVAVAAAACQVLVRLAPKLGLLDHPSEARKHHAIPTPVVGGLAIAFAGFICTMFVPGTPFPMGLMCAIGLIATVGALDDKFNLPWTVRFVTQAVAACLIIFIDGAKVASLGNLFGHDVQLGVWSAPFTILAVIGLMNAINMVDGIDGLAGSLSLMALVMAASVAAYAGAWPLFMVLLPFIGGLIAFLGFNMRTPWRAKAKLFLGNGGSEFLGLIIAWSAFQLTQDSQRPVSPVLAPYFLAPALIDCIAVMLRRLAARRSPFSADRGHLHHILLRAGLSVTQVVSVMTAATALMFAGAWFAWRFGTPEGLNVLVFGLILTLHTLVSAGLLKQRASTAAVA